MGWVGIDFENETRVPQRANTAAIQAVFEKAGVAFTNGDELGVKLGKRS
jgi:hypothetical protein